MWHSATAKETSNWKWEIHNMKHSVGSTICLTKKKTKRTHEAKKMLCETVCVYVSFWIRMQNVEVLMNFPYLLNSCEKVNTIIRLPLSRESRISSNNAIIASPTPNTTLIHILLANTVHRLGNEFCSGQCASTPFHSHRFNAEKNGFDKHCSLFIHNGLNLIKQSVGWVHMMLFNWKRT